MIPRIVAKKKDSVGEIWIYGDIGGGGFFSEGVSAKQVADALKECAGAKTLKVYVASYGGDVFQGMAIYNSFKRFSGKKTFYVDGVAASAASLICMAGDKIVMTDASRMMIHEAAGGGGAFGTAEELREAADDIGKLADELDSINGSMAAIYAAKSGQPENAVRKMMADTTWMTAKEAIAKGFADESMDGEDLDEDDRTEMRAVAFASPLMAKYRKVPAALLARAAATPVPSPKRLVAATSFLPHSTKENTMKKSILRALGLSFTADESEVLATINELRVQASESANGDAFKTKLEALKREHEESRESLAAIETEHQNLLKEVGAKTAGEAIGTVRAWKASHDQVAVLLGEKQKLESQQREKEVVDLVEAAVKDNKITPALKDYWLAEGKKNPDTLKSFLAVAPKVTAAPAGQKEPETLASKVALTDEQVKAAEKAGWTGEKLAYIQEQMAKKGSAPLQAV